MASSSISGASSLPSPGSDSPLDHDFNLEAKKVHKMVEVLLKRFLSKSKSPSMKIVELDAHRTTLFFVDIAVEPSFTRIKLDTYDIELITLNPDKQPYTSPFYTEDYETKISTKRLISNLDLFTFMRAVSTTYEQSRVDKSDLKISDIDMSKIIRGQVIHDFASSGLTERMYVKFITSDRKHGLRLVEEMAELCKTFHSHQTLQELTIDIGDVKLSDGDPVKPIAELLSSNTCIKSFHFWLSEDDVNLHSATLMGDAVRQHRTLQDLGIHCHRLSRFSRQGNVEQMLLKSLATTDFSGSLQQLVVDNACLGNEGGKLLGAMLSRNSSLRKLCLTSCDIMSEDATAIGKALTTNNTLQELSLLGNPVEADGVEALAQHLTGNTTLKLLRLGGSYNRIHRYGRKVASALANMLRINSTLSELHMHCLPNFGDFSREDTVLMLSSLKENTSISTLGLRNCDGVSGDEVFATIQDLLEVRQR